MLWSPKNPAPFPCLCLSFFSLVTAVSFAADDDTFAPQVTGVAVFASGAANSLTDGDLFGGGWSITGLVRDTTSGVNENGTNTSGDNISPNFDITGAAGFLLSNVVFATRPADGAATSFERIAHTAVPAVPFPSLIGLGTHTVRVTVADNDEDTNGDRRVLSDSPVLTFTVVDDDVASPEVGGAVTDDTWTHVWNKPDLNSSATPGEDVAVREALLRRINQLGSGHSAFVSTYTFSGGSTTGGAAGLYLRAISNALARGASVSFVGDDSIATDTVYGASSLTALEATAGLNLYFDDDSFGIHHNKTALFDYGVSGKVVFVSSENLTGAHSFQWNGAVDFENAELFGIYMQEMTNFMSHLFHEDSAKSHAPDGLTFSMPGSWGTNVVRFAPYASQSAGGNNLETALTSLIAEAESEIYIAMNVFTDGEIANALIRAAEANQSLEIHLAMAEYATTNSPSDTIYNQLMSPGSYLGTNRIHFHNIFEDGSQVNLDRGDEGSELIHHKFMVIDPRGSEPVVTHGSANWSFSALASTGNNDENTVILRHAGIAASFFENWKYMTGQFSNRTISVSGGDSLKVFSGGSAVSGTGSGTNKLFTVSDGQAAAGLELHLMTYDADSGLNRNSTEALKATNMQVTVENLATNNVTNFVAALSSADTTATSASNVWKFPPSVVTAMYGKTNRVSAFIPDADSDRTADSLSLSNQQFGYLHVAGDDDALPPVVQTLTIRGTSGIGTVTVAEIQSGAYTFTGLVNDADSGINVNGSSLIQPDHSPYYIFVDPAGGRALTNVFETSFSDGGATSGGRISNAPGGIFSSPMVGTWTALVIMTDNDGDRAGDGATSTNTISFRVINPCSPPTAPAGLAAGTPGVTSFVASWTASSGGPTNYLLDVSSNAAFSAMVLGFNGVSVGTVTSRTVSGLEPGATYYFRVQAQGCTNSSGSITQSVTTVCLSVPTSLVAGSISASGFTASWPPVEGSDGYCLHVASSLPSFASDLFISEYSEGSGTSNKWIEIFNGTGSNVNLSAYRIWKVSNGGVWPEDVFVLSGVLTNGKTYVICNPAAPAVVSNNYGTSWAQITHNGNDALGLARVSGSITSLIDAVGSDGTDPITGWPVAGISNATIDRVLLRKSFVSSGSTNWTQSAGTSTSDSQWIVLPQDTFTNAGVHAFSGGGSAAFVPGYGPRCGISSTAQSVTGLSSGTTYYFWLNATSDFCITANSLTQSVITSSGGDSDGDGLSDANEALFGTNPGLSDTDADGVSDLQEWIAGTQGTSGTSFLSFNFSDAGMGYGRARMDWLSATGRTYKLRQSDQPASSYSNIFQAPGSGGTLSFTNTAAGNSFFRIEVTWP